MLTMKRVTFWDVTPCRQVEVTGVSKGYRQIYSQVYDVTSMICFTALSVPRLYNVEWRDDWWMITWEGSGSDLIEILPWNLLGGFEQIRENSQSE
jgi:hypothetical protein